MMYIIYILFINIIFSNYNIIQSESTIEYFGSHPTHNFSGYASAIQLLSDCNKSNTKELCDLEFKIPIMSLSSGNDNRDNNMLNYLEAFSYPEIKMYFNDFEIKEYRGDFIGGSIYIHGVNLNISIPLIVSNKLNDKYVVNSTFSIYLDQFNIDIPKLLFIPINNEVQIKIELLIEKSN